MHGIEMHEASEEFSRCWQAAGLHLQGQVQEGLIWLKVDLAPPFLEHLSFRLGNQLFFVRIEDADSVMDIPGSRRGLLTIAEGCKGHPPMCVCEVLHGFRSRSHARAKDHPHLGRAVPRHIPQAGTPKCAPISPLWVVIRLANQREERLERRFRKPAAHQPRARLGRSAPMLGP